ncbi:MAG: hypothetical protein U1F77_02220 [Kiritimatiellia bacterium]
METTLSGKAHLKQIKALQDAGYRGAALPATSSVELAVERVRERVGQGGHNIPEPTIRRRFARGLDHLPEYKRVVNRWRVWDTSGGSPKLIDESKQTDT